MIKKATKLVGKSLKKDSIVVYESTVYPGTTEEICVPLLEKYSGLKYNKDFFVVILQNELILEIKRIILIIL